MLSSLHKKSETETNEFLRLYAAKARARVFFCMGIAPFCCFLILK